MNPTVPISDGGAAVSGRSIVNDRPVRDQAQGHVPDTETIQARRAVLNTPGDGFVEAVDGNKIIHPFGDFLLHDVGTGDGIVQEVQQQQLLMFLRSL